MRPGMGVRDCHVNSVEVLIKTTTTKYFCISLLLLLKTCLSRVSLDAVAYHI
jgi:hypothetical protein